MSILHKAERRSSSTPEQELGVRTRRAFLTMGVGAAAGYGAWRWLQTRPQEGFLPRPFRRMLHFNEGLERAFYSEHRLAASFPESRVQPIRTNGDVGLSQDYDPAEWQLVVIQGPGAAST